MTKPLLYILFITILFSSCFEEEEYQNSRKGNFDALWKIMDEKYCFFEYKDIDWQEVYDRYSIRIGEDMTNDELFDVLDQMLAEVKDGHVNLITTFNVGRYWDWYLDYPDNYDEKIQRNAYLGDDYGIAGGMKYTILDDNIGYIYYGSFENGMSESNLNQALNRLAACKGIIFDVRNNGGGTLTYAERLAQRFFNEKTLVGHIIHKRGKAHDDFSKPYKRHIEPSSHLRYQKKVAVLTNRRSYSATNDFVNSMKYAPNAIIIGDKTGGGSGLPFSSELPNGWSVRFSASPMTNAENEHIEFGIDPDIKVDMSSEDISKGIDTIIETARWYLNNN